MKITLSWIKDYLDTNASAEAIAEQLSMLGLVIDDVIDRSKGLEDFIIVDVIAADKHPEADKLKVCTVNTGSETLQIVCGGVNARAGMKAVLAPINSVIPTNGLKIKLGTIRGQTSQGMLCSAEELGLDIPSPEKSILDLDASAPVGMRYCDYAGLNDPIFDVEITPNRGDCLGAYGLARDLAATGIGTLKPIAVPAVEAAFKNPVPVTIADDLKDVCTLFTGVYIRNVKNGPSPEWMQDRLRSVGLRPISALVDITNYMSQSIGRPMHVFDADTLQGGLQVRKAKPGEKIMALNDVEYELDETITVVADQSATHAIGGIIGGKLSGCTDQTTNVFMESAVFDAINITLTGRKLNIITDARQRFERGVDADIITTAQKIATRFILDHCGGEPSEMISVGVPAHKPEAIKFRPFRVKELIGVDVGPEKCRNILQVLGMSVVENGDTWSVTPPSWRHDITLEADLIEEVIRIHGYDHIPTLKMPPVESNNTFMGTPESRNRQKWSWQIRKALCAQGLNEAMSLSFLSDTDALMFGGGNPALKLVNPISSELSDMRPSLLPNLINAVQRNFDRGQHNVKLFEVGKQFSDITPEGEMLVATGVRSGKSGNRNWAEPPRDLDAFDVKADAIIALQACDVNTNNLKVVTPGPVYFHPGRSGYLVQGPNNKLAAFGELHPQILTNMKIDPKVVGFEVFVGAIAIPKNSKKSQLELSPYQAVERDFAFIVDKITPAQDLILAVKQADKDLIAEVRLFDVFEGKNIEADKKSLAISVRIEPKESTMTEEQLNALSNKIIEQVKSLTGGELRS